MNSEADFKNAFCDSVKKQGGYTFKIAAPMMNGLPDIYCVMPGYAPVLLEAKYIKDCGPTFKRKIPYRPLQREILNQANRARNKKDVKNSKLIAFGLVGVEYDHQKYCVLVNPELEVITHKELEPGPGVGIFDDNQLDVFGLFSETVYKYPLLTLYTHIPFDHEIVT